MYCARGGASMPMSSSARVDERHLVGEARQPVDPVDQRRDLRVGAELGELLVAAVHVADDRVGRDDALAVEAHHEAQRAVGRGVLRPEVQDHVAGVELDVRPARRRGGGRRAGLDLEARAASVGGAHGRHLIVRRSPRRGRLVALGVLGVVLTGHRLDVDEAGPGLHLTREQREVLAQRVALELRREVEVAQARVAVEARRRTSPSTRARASRRPGTRAPTTATCGAASSTSVLNVTPQCCVVDCTCANTWKRPAGAGGAERHLGGLHRRRRVAAGLVALAAAPAASRCRR